MSIGGYIRYPTISGDTIVFSAEDDLWRVGIDGGPAFRLTAGASEISRPRLSPAGDQIAYVAADDGPSEVYVLPISGGLPRRLTFQAAARCVVVGWHPRTGEVIYASTAEQPTDFGYRLFTVDPAGGPPRLLWRGPASSVSYGPGGGVVLGRSIADPARRKRYRGGAAGELWVDETGAGHFSRLRTPPGNVVDPVWLGGRIYFLSDHEGTGNVYSVRPDGTGLRTHTRHRDFYARNLAGDAERLVYHAGARLHLLDPTGSPQEIDVQPISAHAQTARRFVPAADFLDHARLTPDGVGLALVARGRAFTMDHWSGPVRQLGSGNDVRYRLLSPLAEAGRLVAVAADDRPDERIVLLDDEGEHPLADLSGLGYVTELAAAPVGVRIVFATNRQQLWQIDADHPEREPVLLDATVYERLEDLAWSPDGRWVAYTFPDTPRTSAIKVADVDSGRTFRVTQPVLRDARPCFDPGGRYLYFLGQRDFTPELDQVQADVGFPFGARPYLVTLRAAEPSPFVAPGDRPPPLDRVEFDLGGIEHRVVAFPLPEGRYAAVVGLPDRVLVLGVPVSAPDPLRDPTDPGPDGSVTVVDLRTGLVHENYLDAVDELSARGASVLIRSGRRLRVLDADASPDEAAEHDTRWAEPGRASGWIALDRVRVVVRPGAEWRQMFREAWRLQREAFWDPAMSGLDWDALYERYAPLTERIASRAELSDLLWELQGELGTSHAYERDGDYRRPTVHAQGFLGVDWEPDGQPRWRIARLVDGDPWNEAATSPCYRPGADVRPGDELIAVNGVAVGRAGPGELLVGQANHEVELTLTRVGRATAHRTVVRALPDESRARYLDWVQRNRHWVRAVAKGRLGYLHIPDMFRAGYADFVRGFLTELDRDGLVVDIRGNGGGHVSPLVLDRLSRRRGGAEHGRHSGTVPYPLEAPRGPMVLLVDEQTGSDAELFAHQFRARGLGLIVGRRTWGGTIATWPRHELVDGTVTTQPEFCYILGDGPGLENHGVEPDLVVDAAPGEDRPGEDAQLAAAVGWLEPSRAPQAEDLHGAATRVRAAAAVRAARMPLRVVGPSFDERRTRQ